MTTRQSPVFGASSPPPGFWTMVVTRVFSSVSSVTRAPPKPVPLSGARRNRRGLLDADAFERAYPLLRHSTGRSTSMSRLWMRALRVKASQRGLQGTFEPKRVVQHGDRYARERLGEMSPTFRRAQPEVYSAARASGGGELSRPVVRAGLDHDRTD